jgi:hypothetical protein
MPRKLHIMRSPHRESGSGGSDGDGLRVGGWVGEEGGGRTVSQESRGRSARPPLLLACNGRYHRRTWSVEEA